MRRSALSLLVVGLTCLCLLPVAAQQSLTDQERIDQARALLLPLDERLEGAARTNLRNILTRLLTLKGQIESDQLPPAPIDCELSDWTLTETAFGVCQPAGTRTRTETWVRTIVRDAAHGGAACPSPLPSEQRTVSEPCDYVPPPPPPTGDHGYFDQLRKRSDVLAAYSLRDPAQLQTRANGGYSMKNSAAPACVYDATADAAKCVIKAGAANLDNQVRLPTNMKTGESLFVTWDAYFGPEWIGGGIIDQKTWQLGSPFNDIHLEIRNRYRMGANQSPGSVAAVDGRLYPEGGYSVGPNVTSTGTLAPQVGRFYIQPNTWTRWYVHLRAPSGGSQWYEYSLWVADAHTGPVQIFDRLQVRPSPSSKSATWESFWLEFNTSSNDRAGTTFDLVAYVRNVVMLSVSDPTPFLIRP